MSAMSTMPLNMSGLVPAVRLGLGLGLGSGKLRSRIRVG